MDTSGHKDLVQDSLRQSHVQQPCHTSGLLTTYFQAQAAFPASAALFFTDHVEHPLPSISSPLSPCPLHSLPSSLRARLCCRDFFTARPSSPTPALPHRSIAPPDPRHASPPSDPPYTGSILTFDCAGRPGCCQSPTHMRARRRSVVSPPDLLLLLSLILRSKKKSHILYGHKYLPLTGEHF